LTAVGTVGVKISSEGHQGKQATGAPQPYSQEWHIALSAPSEGELAIRHWSFIKIHCQASKFSLY
jgi:hypothetical protein